MNNSPEKPLSGATIQVFILYILGAAIVATCAYLTKHYFEVHFPDGLSSTSLCNLSSFFTCDSATNSPLAQVWLVPTSVFGLFFGLLLIMVNLFHTESLQENFALVAIGNFAACVILFVYSLAALGTLCPFCTLYYVLSGIVAYMYWKYQPRPYTPNIGVLLVFALGLIVVSAPFAYTVNSRKTDMQSLSKSLIQQYFSLKNHGALEESPNQIVKSTPNFADAPLRISIFSDFQCPSCKHLSAYIPQMEKRYPGKLNVQYFFFPLSTQCNADPELKMDMHPYACRAARISYCAGKLHGKFGPAHDKVFERQAELNTTTLDQIEAEFKTKDCSETDETKELVKNQTLLGAKLVIRSTPTFFLNEVKIEGAIPLNQLYIIMDEILKRSK